MRLLLIANANIVFGKELQNELDVKGHDTYLLDFESLELRYKGEVDTCVSEKFSPYRKLPKVHMLFRMYFINQFLNSERFDVVNIHYSRWVYLFSLRALAKSRFVITFYGSDFYRASDGIKNLQKKIYERADSLSFTNALTKDAFIKYFQTFEEKSVVCRFGLKTLDYIDKNRDKTKPEIRSVLGYAQDKVIVTCGYNATQGQQHIQMIDALKKIDVKTLEKIQFIFPMTYGDMCYKEQVQSMLDKSNLNYMMLEKYLYEDDNAYVKLASDIMINILETDSFSGSMQEFLYAENYVITGSWLPYELFDKEGVVYAKVDSIDELGRALDVALERYQDKKVLQHNRDVIFKLSHWKNNINSWMQMYEKN